MSETTRDPIDRLLDFLYEDETDDEEEDENEKSGLFAKIDDDQRHSSDKQVKVFSLIRSGLLNNRLLVALVVVCFCATFLLSYVQLKMRHTSAHQTIFSESMHDSVVNKHGVYLHWLSANRTTKHGDTNGDRSRINFQKITSTGSSDGNKKRLRQGGRQALHADSSPPIVDWEGCVDALPDPDLRQHIVRPPEGPVTLVCCNTTKGPLTLEIHQSWAPQGAERFLYMVRDGFFGTKVPLFRALKGFLVQFGLAGDPSVHQRYREMGNLKDDPSWLPLGPPGREINGVKRYQKGYLGYAGAGKNSRGTQLILAFADNPYLGGGSPWEVPFGQVLGETSFQTLAKIYTGYGEKPSQGKIMNRGAKYIEEEFPLVDFISQCGIVKENIPWNYQGTTGQS